MLGALADDISFAVASAANEVERRRLVHDLGERVKELTVLHRTASLLQADRPLDQAFLTDLVAPVPLGWQYPEVCEARIACGDVEARTPGWRRTPWMQSASFTAGELKGVIEVAYLVEKPAAAEGPFLAEERALLQSLADMLSAHVDRQRTQAQLRQAQRIQSLGTLAGGIAHDFNNVLAAVGGNAELAARGLPHDHHARKHLERIKQATTRAADLVQRILAFSRQHEPRWATISLRAGRRGSAEAAPRDPAGVDRDPDPVRCRRPRGAGRLEPDPPGAHEPRHQRRPRDGRARRRAGGRPRGRDAGQRRDGHRARAARGSLCEALGRRHRLGHGPGHARADLRALLHHEGPRPRHRARPVGGPRDREEPRRGHRRREPRGHGHHLPPLLPRRRRGGGRRHAAIGRGGARPRRARPLRGRRGGDRLRGDAHPEPARLSRDGLDRRRPGPAGLPVAAGRVRRRRHRPGDARPVRARPGARGPRAPSRASDRADHRVCAGRGCARGATPRPRRHPQAEHRRRPRHRRRSTAPAISRARPRRAWPRPRGACTARRR